jgi:hypothetical protein
LSWDISEAGNQLEFLLFGDVMKSIGDLDAIYLLKKESWNVRSIVQFQQQLNEIVNQDIAQQRNKKESTRLLMAAKCEIDPLADNYQEYDGRVTIGICATSIFQAYADSSDMPNGGIDKLPFSYFKSLILFRFQILYQHQLMQL